VTRESERSESPPTVADVLRAAQRLSGRIRPTPLEPSLSLSEAAGRPVLLKLENQQRTGSFKVRGALNALASLDEAERARGLVTASAGNHGLGVALAARELGARATVFVPAGAPATKRNRIARYGADLRLVPGSYDDAHEAAEEFARATGALYLHAFSDPRVVAGQGTVGLEILAERPEAGTVVVPVGGGGLIGGIGIVARALRPGLRVVGAQSDATPAMHASLRAGGLVSPPMGETICDGLHGDTDRRAVELALRVVDEMVLVPEAEVRATVRSLYLEEGVVAEGSGAVAAAALRSDLVPLAPGPVIVVVTGSNLDASVLVQILGE
jgi:threonine dehydratase